LTSERTAATEGPTAAQKTTSIDDNSKIAKTSGKPSTEGKLTTVGWQQQQVHHYSKGTRTLEIPTAEGTFTVEGMAATADTLVTAGTPGMLTAVRTTATAGMS
jgi:hypothetical protein